MPLADIAISALKSRRVRQAIVSTGVRVIQPPGQDEFSAPNENGVKSFLGKIFDAGKALGGWVWSKVSSAFSWSATKLFGLFVNTVSFIWNFNFNASDKELYENIESNFVALSGQVGNLTGSSVGYLVGGIVPGAVVFTFNEAVGAKALAAVGDEAKDELVGQLAGLMQSASQNLLQAALTYGFINVRRWIKEGVSNPSSGMYKAFRNIFGADKAARINDWGKEGGQPWSFAQKFEDFIESIDNKFLKSFVEGFFEGAAESFVEAGYVFAGAFDNARAMQQRMATQVLGNQRMVQVIPDRAAGTEPIILAGHENLLRPVIAQTMSNHQLLGNRDVGAIYGLPAAEAARRIPSNLSLTVHYTSRPKGRVVPANTLRKTHAVNVYNLQRSKLDWQTVKTAVGKNGYMFGRWSAIARLDTKDKIVVYGATEDIATDQCNAICNLCKSDVVGMTANKELAVGVRVPGKPLYKEDIMIYPDYITVTNSQQVLTNEKASGTLAGNYLRKTQKLEVWMDDEPSYWSDMLNELFLMPGSDDDT